MAENREGEELLTLTKDELDAMLSRAREEAIAEHTKSDAEEPTSDTELNIESAEDAPKKKFKLLKKFGPLIAFCLIILIGLAGLKIYRQSRTIMPRDHVYVCDNPSHDSDFDAWLKQSIGRKYDDGEMHLWVPTYAIINDGYVIAAFEGDIEEIEFSDKLTMAYAFTANMQLDELKLPDYEISNLKGERERVSTLFGEGTYILELHWIDCPDCIHQDENYTDSIYEKYTTKNIYRYYIKSDFDKVDAKYQ